MATTPAVIVRELARDDLAEVRAIFEEFVSYHEQCDDIFEKVAAAAEMWSSHVYTLQAQEAKCRVFVAELDGKVVGYCLGRIVDKPPIYQARLIGEIANIAVREGHKRKGIGERLFRTTRAWLEGQGVHHIEVDVAAANAQSVGFWTRMGGREFIKRMEIRI